LRRVLRFQVEEAVYTLFAWTSGTFTFEAGQRPDWEGEVQRINPENLLLEGARRIDEWSLIEKKIPNFEVVFALDRSMLANESLSFTEAQRRIIALVDGARDTREVIDASGLSDFDAAQALFGLITAGIAQRVGTSAKTTPGRLLEAQIEEHRNLGVAFLPGVPPGRRAAAARRVGPVLPGRGGGPAGTVDRGGRPLPAGARSRGAPGPGAQ
jgi:hypothetical protein